MREQRRGYRARHREAILAARRAHYAEHREAILARRAVAKLARTISTSSPAVFRLALPLPDLAELRHLVGIVPELRPDALRAPGP